MPEIFDEDFNKPSTSGIKKSQLRIALSTVSRECDRSGVSDRSAAKIASTVLKDRMISENETSNIIDRSKIRGGRSKNRISLQKIGKTET